MAMTRFWSPGRRHTLNWITIRHDAHHLDMHKGNYATITLLYDRMFGTLEKNPLELDDQATLTS